MNNHASSLLTIIVGQLLLNTVAEVVSWNIQHAECWQIQMVTSFQLCRLNRHENICVYVCVYMYMCVYIYIYKSVNATNSAHLIHFCSQGNSSHTSTRAKSAPLHFSKAPLCQDNQSGSCSVVSNPSNTSIPTSLHSSRSHAAPKFPVSS